MTTTAQYIEIRNAADKSVAFLSVQADGLKEAYIENELNSNCSLTFQLPLTSDKWTYITDAYEFLADGKRFILLKPDTEEIVRDGEKVWGKVTAQEKFVELDKEYVTVSNDPNSPGPAWSAVIIVSGGTPAGGFTAGSAGSALSYLLTDSDWTVGTVDVTGTFDLETEKISVLANIQKVQELWGGFLVWDSENKTVSLRDETLWQNYTGFQVRYAKNLKGITRTVNRDLVTRLYPFGKEDLNIASVNGGVLYIDNFTYTNKIYEGQYNNQDITDATELKTKSTAELAKLCKPRYTYKITLLDLSVKPQWAHETFTLGDIADVIDTDVGADDRLRIIRHKYNIFQSWKCEIDIGEPLEKLSSRISDVSSITSKITTTTGTANILKGIINTKATLINGASGDYTLVDGVSTWFGSVGGVRNGKVTRITPNGLIISEDGAQTWKTAIDGSGIYADKLIVSDAYAISSDDGYTKMGSAGISVMDGSNVVKAFLGQYASGKFGLVLDTGAIKIQKAGVDQLYADSNGDLHLAGKLDAATGTFSGMLSAATGSFAGSLTAATGTFTGSLSGATGTFSGSLSTGISITSPVINGGSIAIGSGDNIFKADANGIYLGNATFASAPFKVTQAGAFVAGNATINGTFTTSNTLNQVIIGSSNDIQVNRRGYSIFKFTDSVTIFDPCWYFSPSLSMQSAIFNTYDNSASQGKLYTITTGAYAGTSLDITAATSPISGVGVINMNNINLSVSGNMKAATYTVGSVAGASGTFKSGDSTQKTITVTNGIITGIS